MRTNFATCAVLSGKNTGRTKVKLLSIETTPNPNSMKLNLDERLAKGVAITYTHENRGDCPAYIDNILAIPGVSSVFRVEDFMAIQRKPTAGWEDILSQARVVLEYDSLKNAKPEPAETSDKKWREVTVSVQYFRDLPMLVKVSSGSETIRCAKGIGQKCNSSDRFSSAVTNYQSYQRSKDVDSPSSGGLSGVDKNS